MLYFLYFATKIPIKILLQQMLQFNRPGLDQEFEHSMRQSLTLSQVDWSPIRQLPVYPSNLKADLMCRVDAL